MKHTLLVFALLGVAWPVYAGGDAIVSSTCPGVDAAWAELKELGLLEAKYPANYGTMSRREQSEWRESQALLLRKKGTSFIERFEADLRRWTVAWRMIQLPPRFILSYHDRGFEIIGVSCDIAPGADAPKGRATRSAAQLIEFKEKNGMPWPDYYDGRKHNEGGNALAKRFGITGIPASFLLDREGRVVALNLKGEKSEQAVRRLLAL